MLQNQKSYNIFHHQNVTNLSLSNILQITVHILLQFRSSYVPKLPHKCPIPILLLIITKGKIMQTQTDQSNIPNDVLDNDEEDEVKRLYAQICSPEHIAKHILHDAKITQLPVNLYQIADSIGITVSENWDPNNSDNLMGSVKGNQIVINPNCPNKRFALAFILCDLICQDTMPNYHDFIQDPDKWLTHLALAILMPKQKFITKYNSGETCENIAADFDVADRDFGRRLATLNYLL